MILADPNTLNAQALQLLASLKLWRHVCSYAIRPVTNLILMGMYNHISLAKLENSNIGLEKCHQILLICNRTFLGNMQSLDKKPKRLYDFELTQMCITLLGSRPI